MMLLKAETEAETKGETKVELVMETETKKVEVAEPELYLVWETAVAMACPMVVSGGRCWGAGSVGWNTQGNNKSRDQWWMAPGWPRPHLVVEEEAAAGAGRLQARGNHLGGGGHQE